MTTQAQETHNAGTLSLTDENLTKRLASEKSC